jgi:hypothetical protein
MWNFNFVVNTGNIDASSLKVRTGVNVPACMRSAAKNKRNGTVGHDTNTNVEYEVCEGTMSGITNVRFHIGRGVNCTLKAYLQSGVAKDVGCMGADALYTEV